MRFKSASRDLSSSPLNSIRHRLLNALMLSSLRSDSECFFIDEWNITRRSVKVQDMKVVIAGSSGFIGAHLAAHFEKQGATLLLLSRQPKGSYGHYWNPEKGQLDPAVFEGADVVINLCGETIFGRWNEKKKEQIRESRYISSQFLCQSLLALQRPPQLYIGASAVGYYGDRGEEIMSEADGAGDGFLAEVCSYSERTPFS